MRWKQTASGPKNGEGSEGLCDAAAGDVFIDRCVDRSRWRDSRRATFLAASLISLATVAVYGNSFGGPFIFDDVYTIADNPTIRRLWPVWPLLSPVGKPQGVMARPIVSVSLAINYAISGLDVWSYHALNLAAHVLTALLLFGIVRRTLLLPAARARFAQAATPLALAVALLWAVHPLLTEAVTYIIQRTELLAGLFYLLTLYCVIRGVSAQRPALWYAVAVATCALAMGSKETAASAPLVVLLYDRVFLSTSWRDIFRRRWPLYAGLAAPWALVLLMLPFLAKGRGMSEVVGRAARYAPAQGGVIAHYLQLCFWPHPLVLDYGFCKPQTAGQIIPGLLLIGVLLVATAIALRRQPWLGFLGVWFFAILAPSSSIVPLVPQVSAEKRMYLPLAAVVTGVVIGAFLAGQRLVRRGKLSLHASQVLGASVVVFAGAVLAILTFQRNADYRSEISIWNDTVAKMPNNERACYALARALSRRGELDRAIAMYRRALEILPDYFDARLGLATALFDRGQVDEAIDNYRMALHSKPNNVAIHCCLGMALAARGQLDEAIDHYRTALHSKPNDAVIHCRLGMALAASGQLDDAIDHYRRALESNPRFAEAHCLLGHSLSKCGQIEEAAAHYQLAIADNPRFAEAYNGLGDAMIKTGHWDTAIICCRQAIEVDHRLAEAHANLGVALAACGRTKEAVAQYREALEIKPDHAETYANLGAALASRGEMSEAVTCYEKALKIDPNCAQAHNNLGLALAGAGKLDEAVARYQKALAVKPDYAEAHYNLANVLVTRGRLDQAIAHYRKALEIRPSYVEARERLDRAMSLRQ